MDQVAHVTGINPPYYELAPHMTFHRPIHEADEAVLLAGLERVTRLMQQTRATFHGLYALERQYIVLPAQATLHMTRLLVGINLLSSLPGYEQGENDGDNRLHIKIAETSSVFDRVWPEIQGIRFDPITVPIKTIDLYRKSIVRGGWEKIESFHLPE
ncbi:MAG: hypothetical protein PHD04_02215 [Candidatus Pacebacteria bacterium]|nr:hypothetical protein [Candidatus Paceibacterota bacterium]